MTVGPRGSEPAGTLHAVDDERRAVCGVGRQRFVFPAIRWSAALEAACPDCHAAFATRERARPLA